MYPNVSASAGIIRFSLAVDADNYMIFRNITSTDFIPILEPKGKVSLVLLGLLTFRGSLAAIDMAFERTCSFTTICHCQARACSLHNGQLFASVKTDVNQHMQFLLVLAPKTT